MQVSCGGVGRNIADCLTHMRLRPILISAIGDDSSAETMISKMSHMETKAIRKIAGASTAVYTAVLDKNGECLFGVGDMEIHSEISVLQVKAYEEALKNTPLVAIDANIPLDTMDFVLQFCASNGIPVWFEPTDVSKAAKLFKCKSWTSLDYASPNLNELREMNRVLLGRERQKTQGIQTSRAILEECLQLSLPLMQYIQTLVVTLGRHGTALITTVPQNTRFRTRKNFSQADKSCIRAVHYPAPQPSSILSVSGAGDCLAAAMIGAIVKDRYGQDECVRAGLNAAQLSLCSLHPVPPTIQPDTVFSFHSDYPRPRSIDL